MGPQSNRGKSAKPAIDQMLLSACRRKSRRLEAIVDGPQTEYRCERDLAEQLMTELLRMTADLMSAREAAARLEPVPPARALEAPDKERSGRQLAESFAWRVAARGIASRNPQRYGAGSS
jgi:hypothetical protein